MSHAANKNGFCMGVPFWFNFFTPPYLIIDYVLNMFPRKKYMSAHALNPAETAQF